MEPNSNAQSPIKILCIGDSLTDGYGLDLPLRWTNLLAKTLSVQIVNEGISGDTTGGILSRFYHLIQKENWTHVFIMGGTNDLYFDIEDEIILGNLKTMTRQARHYDIKYCLGIPPPYYYADPSLIENQFLTSKALADRIEHFQQVLRKFAIRDETTYIDFSTHMPVQFFLEDGIHPNEAGQQQMHNIAKPVFQQWIL